MMGKLGKIRQIRQRHQRVISLQKEAHQFFYDSIIANVNDSLTSILAVCESANADGVSKVKRYIYDINNSLSHIKDYRPIFQELSFDVNCTLKSLLHVLKLNYKNAKFITTFTESHFLISGQQSSFEQLFIYVFDTLFKTSEGASDVLIESNRKGQELMVKITKDKTFLSEEEINDIYVFRDSVGFNGVIEVSASGSSATCEIRMPMHLRKVSLD